MASMHKNCFVFYPLSKLICLLFLDSHIHQPRILSMQDMIELQLSFLIKRSNSIQQDHGILLAFHYKQIEHQLKVMSSLQYLTLEFGPNLRASMTKDSVHHLVNGRAPAKLLKISHAISMQLVVNLQFSPHTQLHIDNIQNIQRHTKMYPITNRYCYVLVVKSLGLRFTKLMDFLAMMIQNL